MHTHSAAATARPRLVIALVLSATVFVVEAVAAAFASSLALFAEAFHVLIDVVALAIALVAVWLAARPTSERRTFGMLRLEILATVLNTGLLFLVASVVLVEGVRRLSEPSDVASGVVLAAAAVGLASNAISIALLRDAQSASLTVRAAYLEVLSDLLGSGAVAVSAIVTLATGLRNADTVAAFAIVALIVPRGCLLREALDVLLEATPRGVDLE